MSRAFELPQMGQRLQDRLLAARQQSDQIFEVVRPEFLYERPIAQRHRIVFYIGHLEVFDWNVFKDRLLGHESLNSEFEQLFSAGIDPVDGGLPGDQTADWPAMEQVRRYVGDARARIDKALAHLRWFDAVGSGDDENSPFTLLNAVIEHRLMHSETLAYMLHQLPYEQKVPRPVGLARASDPWESRMVEVPAGFATLGIPRGKGLFGWDNEFEERQTEVPAFAIENEKVSSRRYLEFMNAGGYENPEFWEASDWQWRTANNIQCPVFWTRAGGEWRYRTMFSEIPLPMEWPVYVSHAEARAYACWAGKSLPTEAQWHRAAYGTREGGENPYPWGTHHPLSRRGNFDFRSWDPAPVGSFPENQSAFGVSGLLGNGWEWTSTPFGPLPGFRPFAWYPGYSANFFDERHYVIKGGSARTAASMLRRSFRNWFQPHYQFAYAGFRCVSNSSGGE